MIKSKSAKAGDWIFVLICVVVAIICLLPMVNLLVKSISSTDALVKHEVYLWPKGLNFDAYTTVLGDAKYIRAFFWTVFLTIICTIVSLVMTTLCAYPLIFEDLKGRSVFNIIITITMFFNAGTIPNYLLMKSLNLLSNPLVLIVPSCLSVFNMIILRSFFYGIPDSLRESAETGASYPLQLLLYNIINNINSVEVATQEGFSTPGLTESLKAAIVMFSTVPILCIYPWLQKYFIHGVTVGAVKE